MNILLIAGGWSSEREVSLRGAEEMRTALQSLGHTVTFFDLRNFDQLLPLARRHDMAMINLHGRPGEDGLVQALLEAAHCPYQGSGPAASFLALNKAAAKQVFRQEGLPTADWEFLPDPPPAGWEPRLPYPVFVKSNTGGSSLHLGRADTREAMESLLREIFDAGDEALIETALQGQEVTCGVLGETPLPLVLIEPVHGEFFDYTSKYADNGARELCPAPLDADVIQTAQRLALAAHRALGLKDLSRTDFILDKTGNLHLLEVNTLPGMTPASLIPKEARAIGLEFPQLLERLIDLTMKK